jgi:hypothetical protein
MAAHELERSARLIAAASALRTQIGAPILSRERAQQEDQIRDLRAQLSDEVFEAAWEAGQKLSLDEAVALALHHEQDARARSPHR